MLIRNLCLLTGSVLVLGLASCEKHDKAVSSANPVKQEAAQQGDQVNPAASAKPETEVQQAATPANQPAVNGAEQQANTPQDNQQAKEELQKGISQIDEYLAKRGLDDNTKQSLEKIREELQKRLR